MKISYGITGNYYATSLVKEELIELCNRIGKSPNSIRWHKKYLTWVFRVKSKTHRRKMKEHETRELVSTISDNIKVIGETVVCEFNDKRTRTDLEGDLEVYLKTIHRVNRIEVVCDESNNPPEVVDAHGLVCDLRFFVDDFPVKASIDLTPK